MEKPRRNRDTSAATRGKILHKQRRWAEEMRAAGWSVEEPAAETENLRRMTETPRVRWLYSGDSP